MCWQCFASVQTHHSKSSTVFMAIYLGSRGWVKVHSMFVPHAVNTDHHRCYWLDNSLLHHTMQNHCNSLPRTSFTCDSSRRHNPSDTPIIEIAQQKNCSHFNREAYWTFFRFRVSLHFAVWLCTTHSLNTTLVYRHVCTYSKQSHWLDLGLYTNQGCCQVEKPIHFLNGTDLHRAEFLQTRHSKR